MIGAQSLVGWNLGRAPVDGEEEGLGLIGSDGCEAGSP